MRTLHVLAGLSYSSGPTRNVIALSEGQARLGHEVTLFSVHTPGNDRVSADPALVTTECFPMSLPSRRLAFSYSFREAIRRRIKQFDVVHIHAIWNYPTREAMRTATRAGVPFLVAPRGSFEPWALRHHRLRKWPWMHLVEGPLFHRAAAMHALTEAEQKQIRDFGINVPVVVIPNGVELPAPSQRFPDESTNPLKSDVFTILFLSRVHPKKGLDVLGQALRLLAKQTAKPWRLLIAGDDGGSGYQNRVRQRFSENGIIDRCEFLGEVKRNRKQHAFRAADVFVLPSYSEGLPTAVLEAMAYGLPVVITPGCNLPDVDEYGAGLSVQPEPAMLASALFRLQGDPSARSRMGTAARDLVRDRFQWRAIVEKTICVYERMAAGMPLSLVPYAPKDTDL